MQSTRFPLSVFILALGTFAVGTDAFIVAAFTGAMASDFATTAGMAGQSATVFSLSYALIAPLTATLTATIERRRILVWSLVALGVANVASALAPSLWVLLVTRVGAAASAGTFSPAAGASAVELVDSSRRGRALAIVVGGLSVSTAIGVPIGHLLSVLTNWRVALAAVGALCLVAAAGLALAMPAMRGSASTPLSQRLAVLHEGQVRRILGLTTLGMAAAYCPFAFVLPIFAALGLAPHLATVVLVTYGCGAVLGNLLCGAATDRFAAISVLRVAYLTLAVAFAGLIALGALHPPPAIFLLPAVLLWGAASWAQSPAQIHRLVAAAPGSGALVVALNASAIYTGMGVGTAIGGLALSRGALLPLACGLGFAVCATWVARSQRR